MKRRILSMLTALLMAAVLVLGAGAVPARAEDGPVIRLHYHRADGNYEGWDVWLWEEGHDGAGYELVPGEGDVVATMQVTPGVSRVGFIVRTQDWTKDINADQFIDIAEMVSGTVDIYVESEVEGYTKEYGDDVKKGIKLKDATCGEDCVITVTMTGEVDNPKTAFTVLSSRGELTITGIETSDEGVYLLTVAEELDFTHAYSVVFEDVSYSINMPIVYSTEAFEQAYTYTGSDLGATRTANSTFFRLWAPTAEKAFVNLYESGDAAARDLIEQIEMTAAENGTWTAEVARDLNGTYYTYSVLIDGNENEAVDPYARTTGINGKRGMVIDLDATDPEGWDKDADPNAGLNMTDAIIYEAHIRDLTMAKDAGFENRGRYLGVIETGTKTEGGIATGLDHMKELGITHLHILPMYDFGSVNESKPSYNWGYDPVNYNVPEGSYASEPRDGSVRVAEVKQMVKGLHDNGISVVMDVVYNHVYNAKEFCVNKLVPGYFSRVSANGTYSSGSGCGNDTATERSMVRKYIVDSVNYWADEYHIDGFRFDLVGLMDTETINEIVETVHQKHPNVIFYGEGWSMTTMVTKDDVTLATQGNSALTPGFAYFNDTIRDALKGSVFDTGAGFVSGAAGKEATIARCFMGADRWCKSPAQTINYASCHDNNTLFDRIRLSRTDADDAACIEMNKLAAAIYLTGEGVPFMQAGEEMLRTKTAGDGTYDSNSYSSGDAVNAIDYASLSDKAYADVFEYYKGLIAFRKAHPVLRLMTSEDVEKYVSQVRLDDSNAVCMNITGGPAGEPSEGIFLVFNANETPITTSLPDGEWTVCVNGSRASVGGFDKVSGTVSVDGVSALILVKGETGAAYEGGSTQPAEEKTADTADTAAAADTAGTDKGAAAAADTAVSGSKSGVPVAVPVATGIGGLLIGAVAAFFIAKKKYSR